MRATIRKSPIIFISPAAIIAASTYIVLNAGVSWLRYGCGWGLMIVGCIFLVNAVYDMSSNMFISLPTEISLPAFKKELPWSGVLGVYIKQGLFGRLFNYGTITIIVASAEYKLHYMHKPRRARVSWYRSGRHNYTKI